MTQVVLEVLHENSALSPELIIFLKWVTGLESDITQKKHEHIGMNIGCTT